MYLPTIDFQGTCWFHGVYLLKQTQDEIQQMIGWWFMLVLQTMESSVASFQRYCHLLRKRHNHQPKPKPPTTLPETNISPENRGPLEKEIPIVNSHFQVRTC